jgi:replication-associated recombination protein RarA
VESIYQNLPIIKRFEELEKLTSLNKSDEAYLIFVRVALKLNLLDKANKYLALCKKNNNDSYRKLSAFYKLLTQEDKDVALNYLKNFLEE